VLAGRPTYSIHFPYTTLFRSRLKDGRPVGAPAEDLDPRHRRIRCCLEAPSPGQQVAQAHALGQLISARVTHEARDAHLWDVHQRSEEHTSELQSRENLVCRLL